MLLGQGYSGDQVNPTGSLLDQGIFGNSAVAAAAQHRPTPSAAHAPSANTAADEEATLASKIGSDCHVEGKILIESMRYPGRFLKAMGPNSDLVVGEGKPVDDLWHFRIFDLSDGKSAIESIRFKGFYVDAYDQGYLQHIKGVRLTRGDPEDGDWAHFVFHTESTDSKDVVAMESARFPHYILDAHENHVDGGFEVGMSESEHPAETSWALFRLHSLDVTNGSACGKMPTTTITTTPLPGKDPYDCLDGREQHNAGRGGWSKDKHKWCCRYRALGCRQLGIRRRPTSTTNTAYETVTSTTDTSSSTISTGTGTGETPDEPLREEDEDLLGGTAPDEPLREEDKDLGAASDSQTEVEAPYTRTHLTPSKGHLADGPFDCKSGSALMPQWSYDKKSWCCEHEQVACQPSEASDPYDCAAGYDNWEDGWSEGKREWCCRNHHRGCVEPAPKRNRSDDRKGHGKKELTFDCSIGISIVGQWAFEKKEYCCTHHQIGCYPTVTSDPFDCTAGWASWEAGWSENKKDWCCANAHRGCSNTTSEPFDCTSSGGYAHWEAGWSDLKKDWCCENKNRGCQVSTTITTTGPTEAPFDCDVAHSGNAVGNWSIKQRQWCCLILGKECPTTTTAPFDCDAGHADPHTGWSQHTRGEQWSRYKRNWCCLNENKGCPEGGETNYNCDDSDDQHTVTTWSLRKRGWCCQNENKGCPKPYNCEEGVPRGTGGDWARGWSLSKQAWCCQHEQLGCFNSSYASLAVLNGNLSLELAGTKREQVEDIVKLALATVFAVPESAITDAAEQAAGSSSSNNAWRVGLHVKSDGQTVARVHNKYVSLCQGPGELAGVISVEASKMGKSFDESTLKVGCSVSEEAVSASSTENYDCDADSELSAHAWSAQKVQWCCAAEGKGCSEEYDCDEGAEDMELGWSDQKLSWCCAHKKVGCIPEGSDNEEFNCNAGFCNWGNDWSAAKKQYCCKSASKGCKGADKKPCQDKIVPAGKEYDCEADLCHWKRAWSDKKRSWCCKEEAKGCSGGGEPACTVGTMSVSEGEVPDEYDCVSGYPDYVPKWSQEKKKHCCKTVFRGCVNGSHEVSEEEPQKKQEPKSALPQYDCAAGFPDTWKQWSSDKKDYCCKTSGRACPGELEASAAAPAPGPVPYNCQKGLQFVDKWSHAKRKHCCESEKVGCDAREPQQAPERAQQAPVFDCDKGFPEYVGAWSGAKKAQCCERTGRGCPKSNTAPSTPESQEAVFNCGVGKPEQWSSEKREQCCEGHGIDCGAAPSATPSSAEAKFNCGVGNPEHWSSEKREQCCEGRGIDCGAAAKGADATFNCGVGKPENWSSDKREQCCEGRGIDCGPAAKGADATFNCDVGKPEHWSSDKREQCCEDRGIGCDADAKIVDATFNCDVGKPEHWSSDKREQCCEGRGIDCGPAAKGADATFNCDVGKPEHWSSDKRDQCCEDRGIGCDADAKIVDATFNCDVGKPEHWSQEKRSHCCEHEDVACEELPAEHSDHDLSYNCETDEIGWSDRKKEWCCEHKGRGCAVDSESIYFNCAVGEEKHWSARKGDWCCKNEGRGCNEAAEPESRRFDCTVGKVEDWSEAKRKFCDGHTTTAPFNCDDGYDKWQIGWSDEKKKWCCDHEDRGCEEYDCTVGKEEDWSDMKKKSCASENFDCKAGYANWQDGWSAEKKEWCCAHEDRGCHGGTPEPEPGFDCTVGKVEDWSEEKKKFCDVQPPPSYECESDDALWDESEREWCCANQNRGCAFDCDAGFSNWQDGWSPAKSAWCCSHVDRGCPSDSTSPPYDCAAGFNNWKDGWSDEKKCWCCSHEDRGCEEGACGGGSAPLFDCDAGYAKWQTGWSDQKKEWCCANANQGCPDHEATSPAYDCDAGYAKWQTGWSDQKKEWCCANANHGCPDHEDPDHEASAPAYDCDAGYAKWQTGWSDKKKEWCCANANHGCPDHEGGNGSAPYDCDAGYDSWEDSWDQSQQAWCCRHERKGCRVPEQIDNEAYDCSAGLGNADPAWSNGKKTWCCLHEHVGCTEVLCRQFGGCEERPPPRFDCHTTTLPDECLEAGGDNKSSDDQMPECDWAVKQAWCCQHEDKLCTSAGPSIEANIRRKFEIVPLLAASASGSCAVAVAAAAVAAAVAVGVRRARARLPGNTVEHVGLLEDSSAPPA